MIYSETRKRTWLSFVDCGIRIRLLGQREMTATLLLCSLFEICLWLCGFRVPTLVTLEAKPRVRSRACWLTLGGRHGGLVNHSTKEVDPGAREVEVFVVLWRNYPGATSGIPRLGQRAIEPEGRDAARSGSLVAGG